MATRVSDLSRLEFVDVTRGLLFLLMTSTHALTLANVGGTSFLRELWLPNGWATTSFIMLSGLTIPLVYRWKELPFHVVKEKIHGRSKEILIVMFISNLVMLLLKLLVQGHLSVAMDSSWWLGLVTFSTPYSISAILIPTGLLMCLSPYLIKGEERIGWQLFGFNSLIVVFLLWLLELEFRGSSSRLFQLLFSEGIGGFPVIPFVSLGIVGMAAGFVLRLYFSKNKALGVLCISIVFLILHNIFVFLTDADIVGYKAVSRFLILCCFGVLVTYLRIFACVKVYFSLIGNYALFSFLLHRIILQMVAVSFAIVPVDVPNEIKYMLLLLVTMSLIGCSCLLRQRFEWVNLGLKKIYL